jgi:hypothetical protein
MNPDDFVFRSHSRRTNLKVERAVTICNRCPVRTDCLESELAQMERGMASVGIFGGTTVKQREQILRERRTHEVRERVDAVTVRREPQGCGTNAGYQAHVDQHTDICDPCREARRRYQHHWRRQNTPRDVA